MIINLISALLFLIPTLGMIGGLSVAATIPVFLVILLIFLKNIIKIDYTGLQNYRLELIFAIWCLISCIWAINPMSSFVTYSKVFALLLAGFIVNNFLEKSSIYKHSRKISFWLIAGFITAIIFFFIEYVSSGILTLTFRSIFQHPSKQAFYLFLLDRGCALLSVTAWIIIGILLKQKKYFQGFLFWTLVFFILFISDSLAGFLGFLLGAIAFILSRLSRKFFWLITIATICGSILMPIAAYNISPQELPLQTLEKLPISAVHRLFIWNFVANKIKEQPISGIGFAASKNIQVSENLFVDYQGQKLPTLPLHPHNNVIQIFLETGIIGLILFLSLIAKYLRRIDQQNDNLYQAVAYACFTNYYIIGMISYSIWQLWWICTGMWVVVLLKLFITPKIDNY